MEKYNDVIYIIALDGNLNEKCWKVNWNWKKKKENLGKYQVSISIRIRRFLRNLPWFVTSGKRGDCIINIAYSLVPSSENIPRYRSRCRRFIHFMAYPSIVMRHGIPTLLLFDRSCQMEKFTEQRLLSFASHIFSLRLPVVLSSTICLKSFKYGLLKYRYTEWKFEKKIKKMNIII